MQKFIYTLLALAVSLISRGQTPGSFSGSLDISPMGGATYVVPLDLPEGIGGLQPNLSIGYSSQGGDGIMGKGFSISGVSSISRRNSTVFHESANAAVSYSSSDKFMLDGSVLKYYSTNEYKTELNSASRIKIVNPNTSTAYFTVEGKDGLICEYGNTTDSRLMAQGTNSGQVAVWMLKKVRDRVGRYYTYTYEKDDANGEIRVKQIDYTGSSSSAPFYSVKFNYSTRSYDVNFNYVSGTKFRESKLLTSIHVCYGTTVLKNYALQYEYFDYNYLMTKITVTGLNSEVLKPIEFTWYKNSDFKQNQVKYDQTSNLSKAILTLGDFNGDGRTDFVATPMSGAGWTGWRLYLANADGNGFTYASSGTVVDGLIRLIPGDFNGDGITDFIAHRNSSGGSNVVFSVGTGVLYDTKLNLSGDSEWNLGKNAQTIGDGSIGTFMTVNDSTVIRKRDTGKVSLIGEAETGSGGIVAAAAITYDNYFVYYGTGSGFTYGGPAIITITRPHNVRVGDFNGDGAMDLFVYYTSKSGTLPDYEILSSSYSAGTLTAFGTRRTGTLASADKWDRVEVWDFNGDGLAEVMNLHDNGYNFFKNNGESISKLRDATFPGKKHKINFGDFNGDGKTDMLLTGYNNIEWSEWQTHFSTGLDFERFSFAKKFNTFTKEIYVADLNGDGADDFFAVDKTGSSMAAVQYYLGYNSGKDFRAFSGVGTYPASMWNFYPIDSRGDGRSGFVTTSLPGTWAGYQLYMPSANFTNLVNTIKDSYGNLTTLTYKRMPDATVYTKTNPAGGTATVSGYDCLSFSAPFKLVSNVNTSNGVGGYKDMTYKYENAKVFKRGRGLLGFTKVIRTDVGSAMQTTVTQEFSGTYYQAATKQVEEKKTTTGRVLTQTDYTNTLSQPLGAFSFLPTTVSRKTYEPNSNYLSKSATTVYVYDSYGSVTNEATTYGNNDKTEVTNVYADNTTSWQIGQLTKRTTKNTVNAVAQTNTAGYTYYANGLLETETIEPSNAALKILTTFTYDTYGNLTKKTGTTNSQTRSESYSYTSGRYPSTYTDVQGNVTTYSFTASTGLMESESSCGVTNTYTYDGFGRIKMSSANTGEAASVAWSWTNGSPANSVVLKRETIVTGQVLQTWFDAFGREIQHAEKNFAGTEVASKTVYNALGQVYTVSEPYFSSPGIVMTHTYDTYGRLTSKTTPYGTVDYAYSGTATGAKTTVTDRTVGDSYTSAQTYDLSGKLKTVVDSSGETITYTYGSSGNPTKIQVGSSVTEMVYDLFGRQTKLIDPNAGTIVYSYNNWGDLLTKTDARGQVETYNYLADGRIDNYKRGTETFAYQYNSGTNIPKDQVKMISNTSGMKTEHVYDAYGRQTKVTETIEANKAFAFEYRYNSLNQLEQKIYPGSKAVKYEYGYGDLRRVIWGPSSTVVWEKLSDNAKGQLLSSRLGNGMTTDHQYTAAGTPVVIKALNGTSAMLNLSYPSAQIDSRGNIKQRKDDYKAFSETFAYDNLNRLSTNVSYSANGNISTKTGVGTYAYGTRPHAVTSLTNVPTGMKNDGLSVTYNAISRPLELSLSSTHKYTLTYGTGNQRVKSVYIKPGATTQTKYYVGPYEEIVRGSTTQKNYYIYAGGEIAAVYTEGHPDLTAGLYYFHNDHIGSPWLITNSSKTEVQRLSYDAWGRRRDANNWSSYANLPAMKFDRGYTGHEHLDMFDLVNMNARLYDPVLGRFLSADPFVQTPDFSQAYNRYSYANNNPLMYKDPNGELAWFVLPVIAIVSGITNVAANWKNIDGFWQGLTTFGVGAGAVLGVAAVAASGGSLLAVAGVGAAAGAVTSGNNNIVAQTGTNFSGFNQIDWGQVGEAGLIGGAAGFAGGAAGSWASNTGFIVNGVSHPLAKSAIVSPLAAGAGHVAGGTTAGLLQGQDVGTAFGNSFNGIGQSMAIGGAIGVGTTAGMMYANGINPITNRNFKYIQPNNGNLQYDSKQIGEKYGKHRIDYPGISHEEYLNLAKSIYENQSSTKTTYPPYSPKYPGETHYYNNGNLLRIAPNGTFRSLYPIKK